jgi:hypothetical protein
MAAGEAMGGLLSLGWVLLWSLIGKTVQFRRGPAAVTDENVWMPLSKGWEGQTFG